MKAMGDRQDIDALLVGALYGELDSDERARLDSHLATHPADRTALDGLRSTRAMLRDSGASAAWSHAEPPAAISAKLLQEAARRAPSPAAIGVLGFLATLFRPIGRHPALSAAAALVLVVGAGRLMMRDGKLETAEPTASAPSFHESSRAAGAPPPAAAAGAGSAADDYRVGLDEGVAAANDPAAGERLERPLRDQRETLDGKLDNSGGDGLGRGSAVASGPKRAGESKDSAAARPAAKPAAPSAFLAIDKGSPASELALKSPDAIDGLADDERRSDTAAATVAQGNTGGAQTGAGASGGSTTRGAQIAGRAPQRDEADRDAPPTGGSPGQAAPRAPTASPAPARVAPSSDPGAATSLKKEAAVEAWARDQHSRMVKLVNSGKCTEVGQIGAEIARKAPEYYQAAVANDRALRSCQAYVDRARRARVVAPAKSKAGNSSPAESQQDDVAK